MSDRTLTEQDAREALSNHVVVKAQEARAKYGGVPGWPELLAMLEDREVVRFPCRLAFSAEHLQPGEFAWAQPLGSHPNEGFCLWMHPQFEGRDDDCLPLAAYHLVTVNYGDVATNVEAENFGAELLGMNVEAYYERVCALADELAP